MRIATFNMENLFTRPVAMGYQDSAQAAAVLQDFDELNRLIGAATYDTATKDKLKTLLEKYDFQSQNNKGDGLIRLHEIREKLYKVPQGTQQVEIVAKGRGSWVGWFDLVREDINWPAIENTGRVVDAVDADVLLTVEVEDRLTLERFNRQVLAKKFNAAYAHHLLVDGNDTRGIDIGLYSRFPILGVRSHSDEEQNGQRIFSRDCPEFDLELPGGQRLVVLGNHFKSKGYGPTNTSAAKRLKQAKRAKAIYQAALARSPLVVVAGDLNDTPASPPITALTTGTQLKDAMKHPTYTSKPNAKPGTYETGNSTNQKIDYLFLSPALFQAVTDVDVERRGVYAPVAGNPFPTVTSKVNQASDHGALWADVNV
jgi:endonuclease/exonuclease/phosphatase family metal-dependent hydrolase